MAHSCCQSTPYDKQRCSLSAACAQLVHARRLCWWREGLALLFGAALLSAALPGAPLARSLLSEDVERHRLLAENEERVRLAQQFLDRYRAGHPSQAGASLGKQTSQVDVGITVLTTRRGKRMVKKLESVDTARYLTQTVGQLLKLLNDSSLTRTYSLQVCNVDERPDLFLEAKELEGVVPIIARYGETLHSTFSQPGLRPLTAPANLWEKLKQDYVFCLNSTLRRGARYSLLLEDDALAHPQVFRVLEHVMNSVLENPAASPVAYLKLYHPQRLLGYLSLEVERLTELLALAVTLGGVLTLLQRRDVTKAGLWRRWTGWAVVVAVTALAVGRSNLLELRRLSVQLYQVTPTPSCCIPAVLYTRGGAHDLVNFLQHVTCTARRSTDIRMDEFRHRGGWRGLMVQPSVFQHIGLVSSLRTSEVSPLIVQ